MPFGGGGVCFNICCRDLIGLLREQISHQVEVGLPTVSPSAERAVLFLLLNFHLKILKNALSSSTGFLLREDIQ